MNAEEIRRRDVTGWACRGDPMKIALIRPHYYTHLITPPLGLGYLASYLKKAQHQVEIIDGLNLTLSNQEIAQRVKGAGLAGITCLSDFYSEVKDLVGQLKRENLPVVLGGPHVTALPQESLQDTGADFVVAREGEETLLELANCLENNSSTHAIKGLMNLQGGLTKRGFIANLDSLPFPDWAQIDPRCYRKAPHGAIIKRFPAAPVITTRGCLYSCTFCASPYLWQNSIRFRSPENVVDEIEYLVRDFGVREIHFEDDNLTLKKEHIGRIADLIIQRNLDISWATPNGVRADTLTVDLIRLMKKSGCYFLAFGIESANQQILDTVHKDIDLGVVERAVRLSHKEGILTQGFFIFGLPGETEETIQETIHFAKAIPLDRAQFLLFDPLPGSQLWQELEGAWDATEDRRSYQEVKWVPPTIQRGILEKAPAEAFRSFFFRPRQLFKVIRYARLSQIPFLLRRLKDFGVLSSK